MVPPAGNQTSQIILPESVKDQDGVMDIGVETPIGKLAAKGFRLSDLIALLTLVTVVSTLVIVLQIARTLDAHESHGSIRTKELSDTARINSDQLISSVKEWTKQQKKLVCILSIPQEKREKEYMSPDSFCNQMSSFQ